MFYHFRRRNVLYTPWEFPCIYSSFNRWLLSMYIALKHISYDLSQGFVGICQYVHDIRKGDRIYEQMKMLGGSFDWGRARFTMEEVSASSSSFSFHIFFFFFDSLFIFIETRTHSCTTPAQTHSLYYRCFLVPSPRLSCGSTTKASSIAPIASLTGPARFNLLSPTLR